MKVYIVFRAFWMDSFDVYKVFLDKNRAEACVKEQLKLKDVRSYFCEIEIEDFNNEF